jgi:acetyl esterase
MFFGGGWVGGSTSQFYKQAKYLASRGMVVFCADYRVRSRHQTTPAECVKDGKSAMRWVRANAEKWKVDPARIAAGGGSAGGHVAAATATVDGFEEEGEDLSVSCRPNALILFNPVYDNGPDGYGNDRVKDYWRQISPLHNLSKETPPTLVFFGTKDKLIPVATAESYRDKMNSLGGDCELHLYEGAEHAFFNSGGAFADTLKKADLFLVRLGYLEGEPGDTSVESIERLAAGR